MERLEELRELLLSGADSRKEPSPWSRVNLQELTRALNQGTGSLEPDGVTRGIDGASGLGKPIVEVTNWRNREHLAE